MLRYWDAEQATAAKIVSGWLLTGDTVHADERGQLYFHGRSDDIIKSGGYRLGPAEVEAAIMADPRVAECAVIGLPDPMRGQAVTAFVRLRPGSDPAEELTRSLQQQVRTVGRRPRQPARAALRRRPAADLDGQGGPGRAAPRAPPGHGADRRGRLMTPAGRSGPEVMVVGAGTMGRGIATVALLAGCPTTLVDVDPAALGSAQQAIERRVAAAAGTGPTGRLHDPDRPGERRPGRRRGGRGRAGGGRAQEHGVRDSRAGGSARCAAGDEHLDDEHIRDRRGRRRLAAHRRHALLQPGAPDGARRGRRRRADKRTDDGRRRRVGATLLGKEAIVVQDVPGFVTSRLGLLLGSEAMRLVEEGVASSADVDKAMSLGYGHPMGPLELADLVGLDARLNNLRSMHERSGLDLYRAPAILERLVSEGRLGRKSGSGFFEYDEDGRAATAATARP